MGLADGLGKTTGQIASAVWQLIAGGYVRLEPAVTEKAGVRGELRAFPTSQALKLEPAFERMSEQAIDEELARLGGPSSAGD